MGILFGSQGERNYNILCVRVDCGEKVLEGSGIPWSDDVVYARGFGRKGNTIALSVHSLQMLPSLLLLHHD